MVNGEHGGSVARIFKFVGMLGNELHTVNDPEEMLPIPTNEQEICIGNSRMLVESVTVSYISESVSSICLVRVHELS
jgi:hypothetical protein